MIIIDRFEEGFAICEKDGAEYIKVSRDLLPEDAKEGDVVITTENSYIIDRDATKKRIKTVEDKFFGLFD